jgi:hypothetical protein
MRMVRAVPDQSMLVSGQELRTFECPSCGGEERRLVLARTMGQLATEQMRLPPVPSLWGDSSKDKMSVVARTAWSRAVLMLRGSQPRGS